MKRNMGAADRIIRAVVGLVLVALAIWVAESVVWDFICILFAAIMLLTAAIGYCPLYVPFKISTLKK